MRVVCEQVTRRTRDNAQRASLATRGQHQHHKQDEPEPETETDQFLLDGQQRFGRRRIADFFAEIDVVHDYPRIKGGVTPPKNTQEMPRPTQMMKPNKHRP